MKTLDNLYLLSKPTALSPRRKMKVTEETLWEALKLALIAMKWFLGRQVRGRVRSVFSAFIFKLTVDTIEKMVEHTSLAHFDEVDAFYAGVFEKNHPGISIDQRFDKTVKQ